MIFLFFTESCPEYISEAKRCLVTNGTLIITATIKSLKEGFEIYSEKTSGL